jgi:serine protease
MVFSSNSVTVNAGFPSDQFDELNEIHKVAINGEGGFKTASYVKPKPLKTDLDAAIKGSESNNRRKLPKKGGKKSDEEPLAKPLAKDGMVKLIISTTKTETGYANAAKHGRNHKAQAELRQVGVSIIEVPEGSVQAEMEALKKEKGVTSVDFDTEVHALPHFRGTDENIGHDASHRRLEEEIPEEEIPYGIGLVKSQELPDLPPGSQPIKICVIDTGYNIGHVDLPSDGVTGFSPYEPDQKWDNDGHGHGSHCAGTIGAIGGNEQGVVGVFSDPTNFRFHIGKGLTDSGSGSSSAVLQAVESCLENGAKVISMSLGGGGYLGTTDDVYKSAYNDNDTLIIAAAGNGGNSAHLYPASYDSVMSVAAIDSNKDRASFSQYNDKVQIAAPGVGVKSTVPNNEYKLFSGTSMATPHVAGVAALVWSHFPQCTNHQIRGVLMKSAEKLSAANCDNGFGFGLVDAKAAYDLLSEQGCDAGNHNNGVGEGGCVNLISPPTPPPSTSPPVSPPSGSPPTDVSENMCTVFTILHTTFCSGESDM